jgi:hypothetical protein
MDHDIFPISIERVKACLIPVRGMKVLLDRDVATLYGVETRIVNQAVRNNPEKFPSGYVFELEKDEVEALRSKKLILEKSGRGQRSKYGYKVFTERGLYMLATILKGAQAVRTTLAIIDTYAQIREMSRVMQALQHVQDGGREQHSLLQRTGELLSNAVSQNLTTESSETEIEFNFAVVKIRHKFFRRKA